MHRVGGAAIASSSSGARTVPLCKHLLNPVAQGVLWRQPTSECYFLHKRACHTIGHMIGPPGEHPQRLGGLHGGAVRPRLCVHTTPLWVAYGPQGKTRRAR